MEKKQNIILGCLLAVIVILFASFNFLTKTSFNIKRIKGDISQTHTGTVWITCTSETVKVNQSITCTLMGRSNGTVKAVEGLVTNNANISISVVKSNNFANGNNGNTIGYYNGNIAGNTDFEISTITVTGTNVGTGSISFGADGNAIFGDDEYNDVTLTGTSKNITVEPEIIESDNNYLASLSLSAGTISFNKTITEYNVTVPYSVSNITVTASKEDNTANIESGTGSHDLNVGNNQINVVVRAQNGTPRTYTINVTREARTPSSDASLSSLTVTGANIGIFSPSQTTYTATVENSVTNVTINATGCEGSTVTGDTGNKTLYVKTNKFIIHVTAENGTTTKDYVINIIRKSSGGGSGLSSINTLSYLSVSNTKIATKFSPNVTSYSASVGHSVTSVTISATATEKNKAVVTGTGTFQLKEGTNNYNVICTAEDGTPNIYRISINREAKSSNNTNNNSNSNNNNGSRTQSTKDNNSLLKELTINNNKINITDGTFAYKYTVLYKVNSLVVKAIPKSNKSTISINGDKELQVGKNAVTITVTAEDGSSSMYVVTVTRKDEEEELSKDATLDTLVIDGYNLNFEPSKYTYDLKITKEKQLNITYSASNTNSNVVITGNEDLSNGSAINIIVTAEDGSSAKYIINIKKGPSILKIVLIIILGLLLTGGALAAYYFLVLIKKNKKTEEIPEEVQSFNNDVFITDENFDLPEENKEEEVNKEPENNLPFEKIDN